MIRLLLGENEFLKRERLAEIIKDYKGEVDRVNGEQLEPGDWYELLQGQTLFSQDRMVIISDASESDAWQSLPDVQVADGVQVVFLEKSVDKRTKVYKWLSKHAKVEVFDQFSDRQTHDLVKWCVDRAKQMHCFNLDRNLAEVLVSRLGHDQMRIDNVLGQLSLVDKVDQETVDAVVPLAKAESVFGLLEDALAGKSQSVHQTISYLESDSGDDGAYRTLGLLVSQVVILSALMLSNGDVDRVARDFSANPYMVRKLASQTRNLTMGRLEVLIDSLSRADMQMKSTTVGPWLILESALLSK